MAEEARVLGVVPARGGSKGIPRKNLAPLAGRPLLAWTADAALAASSLHRVILSSDDPEILAAGREFGLDTPFTRPAELATDAVSAVLVAAHALETLPEYTHVVLLQPTSPLRTAADIDACVRLCLQRRAPACVSVCAADKSPEWMYRLSEGGGITPVLDWPDPLRQRQDLLPTYAVNGAVYVAARGWLRERRGFVGPGTLGWVMPKERSVDVDDMVDLMLCEALLKWRAQEGEARK